MSSVCFSLWKRYDKRIAWMHFLEGDSKGRLSGEIGMQLIDQRAATQIRQVRRQINAWGSYGLLVTLIFMGAVAPMRAQAQNDTWTGGAGSGNPFWDLATNWSAGLPGSTSNALIGARYDPTFRTGTVSISSLQDQGSLLMTGGSLSVSSTSFISGLLTLSGGTLGGN